MPKHAIALIVMFAFFSCPLVAQNSIQQPPRFSRPSIQFPAKAKEQAQLIKLSADSIFVTISDNELPFKIDTLDKSYDHKSIGAFLNDFYGSSKAKRTNDIVVRSNTKRVVAGEFEFEKMLIELRKRYGINVVFLPGPTGYDPNSSIRAFAKQYSK